METIPLTPTETARFWDKVDKTGDCWEWRSCTKRGYGVLRITRGADGRQKALRAHRIAYELLVGPIPDGLMIDHKCRNRICVNPDHLRPVTNKQNGENLSGPRAGSKSGYRGVSWKSRERRWLVAVFHNGKHHYGGYFTDRHEAGEVAQKLRQELFTHSSN